MLFGHIDEQQWSVSVLHCAQIGDWEYIGERERKPLDRSQRSGRCRKVRVRPHNAIRRGLLTFLLSQSMNFYT
jgi:hypothetical protein